MIGSVELVAIEEWIYGVLSQDEDLTDIVGTRIFEGAAPKGQDPPLVLYQQQTAQVVRGLGPDRIMVKAMYLVNAVVEGKSYSPAIPIAKRIDQLLNDIQGATGTNGTVLASVLEEPFKLGEVDSGKEFKHLGGSYLITAQ